MYINFWTPGSTSFKVLEAGELFLFKLHKKKMAELMGKLLVADISRILKG